MHHIKNFVLNHLKKIGLSRGDHILLYSKISSFGFSEKKAHKTILKTIIEFLGLNGTLIMPSYTFGKKKIFYLKKLSINHSTGILVKEFFKDKKILRSLRPIHSHIGIGKKSNILKKQNNFNSFGYNSDFDLLTKENFKCVFLGCSPNEGGTYFHHLEYLNNVPYRKQIVLKRQIFLNGKKKIIKIRYFDKPEYIKFDFDKAFKNIIKIGAKVKKSKLKYGSSSCIKLKDFFKYGDKLFKKNKNCLLKK